MRVTIFLVLMMFLFFGGFALLYSAWQLFFYWAGHAVKQGKVVVKELPAKKPNQLNAAPAIIETVKPVGVAVPVFLTGKPQVCKGCGRAAWMHENEEDFRRCNGMNKL